MCLGGSHQEFCFGYLDAIREVFTDAPKACVGGCHVVDAGLGPYDVPPASPPKNRQGSCKTTKASTAPWVLSTWLSATGCGPAATTTNYPAVFGPGMQARADQFAAVMIRMKLRREDGQALQDSAQLFWSTTRLPESETTSERFQVTGDGQWHDYPVPVSQNPRWRGMHT